MNYRNSNGIVCFFLLLCASLALFQYFPKLVMRLESVPVLVYRRLSYGEMPPLHKAGLLFSGHVVRYVSLIKYVSSAYYFANLI